MEQEIINSWLANANNWNHVIDNNLLQSRLICTNQAIVNAVVVNKPKNVIDIGCGEGWLCRALLQEGINCTGIDLVPQLIEACQQKDPNGNYYTVPYNNMENFASSLPQLFDIAVFNFALIGQESVTTALKNALLLLNANGFIVIQTLNPYTAAEGNFNTGWRHGSWKGMEDKFTQPYQWYYRNFSAWIALFNSLQLKLVEVKEPQHPDTGTLLSVIFTLQKY